MKSLAMKVMMLAVVLGFFSVLAGCMPQEQKAGDLDAWMDNIRLVKAAPAQ